MSYKVNIDNFDRNEWERHAKQFDDYSIYQTWPYQQVRTDMAGQRVSRILIKDEMGHIHTICQVRIKHVKILGLNIGYVQCGPLVRLKHNNRLCPEGALEALRKNYVGSIVDVLRIVPNIRQGETGTEVLKIISSSGFVPVRTVVPYRTFVVNVGDCEEGIRKRLRKSFRRDLKKAENMGIKIREGCDEEFYEILDGLYRESLKRKGFKGLNAQEFLKPQNLLSNQEKMNIIVAYYQGEPVTALLMSNLGDSAIVLLAASNEKGLVCGSSYLVWYRGALSALRAGMKFYDLGGIDPDNNPNVYQFKSRMGGQKSFHVGAFDTCRNFSARVMWYVSEKAYNRFKK